jgi:hypothetical protein
MLKTTSRMFVKNTENEDKSSDFSIISTQKSDLASVNQNAPIFNINASRFAPQMSNSMPKKLVNSESIFPNSISSCNIIGRQAYRSVKSNSDMSLTIDVSPKTATQSSKPAHYSQETSVRLNFSSGTFKTCVGVSHDQPLRPQFNCQNFTLNQTDTKPLIVSELECNNDEATDKKKTRRGGRKARLRRDREKERTTTTAFTSIVSDPSDKQQVKKTEVKYKTELCKNWIETGRCNYSIRCMFAHGNHELVTATKVEEIKTSYKQELCERYHNFSECSYGTRCVYVHDQRSTNDLPSSFFGKNMNLLEENTFYYYKSKRLSVFEQITSTEEETEQTQDLFLEINYLPLQSKSIKTPKEDCLSCASEQTDTSDCGQEEIYSLLEPAF